MAKQAPISVPRSELSKIPFIDAQNIGGRVLSTLTFYESDKWHMWIPTPDGLLWLLGEPCEGQYFAGAPQSDLDFHVQFLDFMVQRACWPDTLSEIGGISCDIHNLGASLAKLEYFYELSKDQKTRVTRFVTTEVEYIFSVCRSFFDLLQKTILRIWNRVRLNDSSIVKKNLPDSFRKMVIKEEKLMSAEEIANRWSVPLVLAEYYARQGPFFEKLRSYRDQTAHHGADLRFLFVTERGFAVPRDEEPFAAFSAWNDSHMLPNRLASLRPMIAFIIMETFRSCEEFTAVIQKAVVFPSDVAPGFKLFVRGHHNQQLLSLKAILDGCLWWDQEPVIE